MRIVRDDRYGILRTAETIWTETNADELQTANPPRKDDREESETNIFDLARSISEKAYSRRRVRRSSSII